jgi:RNA polymerase sigma factor (sigma-70 family)
MADGNAPDDLSGLKLARVSHAPDPMRVSSAVSSPVAAEDFSVDTGLAVDARLSIDQFLEGISARAFRFAELGLRHREDALDAVQDAMIKMMGYRERPSTEWTPLFWSILRSRMIDMKRRSVFRMRWLMPASSRAVDDDAVDWIDQAPDDAPGPARLHENREAYQSVATALRGLPTRQREAFTLRVLEDCDVATTARIMGCSEGSVKTHLSRARDTLQRQLEDFR